MTPLPIFDGHNDTLTHLYPLVKEGRSFFKRSNEGHLDLPRSREGGLIGGIFAIWTPPPKDSKERDPYYGLIINKNGYEVKLHSPLNIEYAKEYTNSLIVFVNDIEKKSNGEICIVKTYQDLENNNKNGIFSIVLHIEGAEAIKKGSSDLDEYYQLGLRSLGLVWSRPNVYGNGVPFRFPHSPDTGLGLTIAGKKLVKECNRLGILIDLAHLNEKGFWDVAKLSDNPLVVSHAGVHSLCPSTRNLTDKQIDAIGATDGVIGIIFEPSNTRPNGQPGEDAPITDIVNHIEYVVKKIGIDHVAFGSDFDGAQMRHGLHDVTDFPNLIEALSKRGFDHESLEKIAYRNWFRVFRQCWNE